MNNHYNTVSFWQSQGYCVWSDSQQILLSSCLWEKRMPLSSRYLTASAELDTIGLHECILSTISSVCVPVKKKFQHGYQKAISWHRYKQAVSISSWKKLSLPVLAYKWLNFDSVNMPVSVFLHCCLMYCTLNFCKTHYQKLYTHWQYNFWWDHSFLLDVWNRYQNHIIV